MREVNSRVFLEHEGMDEAAKKTLASDVEAHERVSTM
jgi:hypothetical protein